jgi:Bacterial inner membrane protein
VEHLLAVTVSNPIAAGFGFAAMVCLAAWPLCRARSTMLMTYTCNNVGFLAHFALLGQWTAAAMNGLIGVQTVVAIWLIQRPRLRWVYYAFIAALAAGSVITWQGLPSLLAAAATLLSTIGRMQGRETSLRAWMLASTPFWMAHDLAVGSLPGLIADLLSMAIGATMLLKRSPVIHAAIMNSLQRIRLRAADASARRAIADERDSIATMSAVRPSIPKIRSSSTPRLVYGPGSRLGSPAP